LPLAETTDAAKKAKKKAKKAAVKAEVDKKGVTFPPSFPFVFFSFFLRSSTHALPHYTGQTAAQQNANEDKGLEPPAKDDDPEGIKLLSSPEGLENAAKLLRPITNLLSNPNAKVRAKAEDMIREKERMEVWLASYDVAIRRRGCFLSTSAPFTS
jgi:peptide alpha-N-acetyltransferase